jgi:uncharacterized protein involved in exopolysaccharide biosynthesis
MSATPETATRELSLFDLAGVLLGHWRVMLGLPLSLAVVVEVATVVVPRTYVATASFMPQSGDAERSRLTGLAAQFGIGVPGARGGASSALYAGLVKTRSILGPVAAAQYSYVSAGDTVRGTLTDLIGPRAGSMEGRRAATILQLRAAIDVETALETGIVTVSVSARNAALARGIADSLLGRLSVFDLDRRRAQAASERVFIEERLAQLGAELRGAEARLEDFLIRNRDFHNSPELTFQNDRLARDVAMRQQIYTSLAQAYEQARVDEARNTPVLSIIERPETPTWPKSRGLVLRGVLSLMIGLLLATGIAATLDFARRCRARDPQAAAELWARFASMGREILGVLRGRRGRARA